MLSHFYLFLFLMFCFLFQITFNRFLPFQAHALFLEIPPAVHATIEDFKSTNPDFILIQNCQSCCSHKNSLNPKKSTPFSPYSFIFLLNFLCLASVPSVPVMSCPDKAKKHKSLASMFFFSLHFFSYSLDRVNVLVSQKKMLTTLMVMMLPSF